MPPAVNVARSVQWLVDAGVERLDLALLLGSGLSPVAACLGLARLASYDEVPGWPEACVAGHEGALYHGESHGRAVLAACGRVHAYEDRGSEALVHFPRVLAQLGRPRLVLTAAAGGLRPEMRPGDLVVVRDHLDTTWHALEAPLRDAPTDAPWPLACYSEAMRVELRTAAERAEIPVREGVYAFCRGPQYETASEIRVLQSWGCDVVGMSVVPEATAAAQLGLEVGAVAVVTNLGTGMTAAPHDHEQVTAAAEASTERLAALLGAFLESAAQQRAPR